MVANLVKVLILVISISCLFQNVLSETALKIYDPTDYKGEYSLYYIGPYNNTFLEPLKFKLSFDMEEYRDDPGAFVFCLCFPSIEDDVLGSNVFHCGSIPGRYSSRICLNDQYWYVKDMHEELVSPSVQSGTAEIDIAFYHKSVTELWPKVTVNSTQFSPDTIEIEHKNFKQILTPDSETFIKIGAYSNKHVSVTFDDSKYRIIKAVPDPTTPVPPKDEPIVPTILPVPIPLPQNDKATTAETEKTNSAGVVLIVLGVLIGLLVLVALIIITLRFVQGIWCCGLIGKKKSKSSEDGPPHSVVAELQIQKGVTKSSDEKHRSPSSTVPDTGGQESTGQLQQEGDGAKEGLPPLTPPPPPPLPPPPPPTASKEKKGEKAVVSRETKDTTGNVTTDEKTSDGETDGATTGATGATTTTAAAEKKKERVPNMLLLATKEEDTQSEGQIPSKRKTKVEKHNKEPAPTKNITQDPGAPATKGLATGKPAATTLKAVTGIQRTEAAKTGLPKSETDLVTDEKAPANTKGVSTTQADKTTVAKGTTQVAPTQTFVGTQTTQGGGKTKKTTQEPAMATGVGKTSRFTGATQIPTAETNETQYPTGGTKTKATQLATGATQKLTTGTTQGATGTTQRGTTMATGKTQMGTNPTQARTSGTRQTGETQNPDEADIDFTQIPGTVATRGSGTGTGGTRPTQFPSDADADPTQNPTAFTGGGEGGRTSKTQFGATGTNQTQAGTSKTRTRDTQKQTNRTDGAL